MNEKNQPSTATAVNRAQQCPACGQPNQCQQVVGKAGCWCQQLPAVPLEITGNCCYCPRCLTVLAAQAQQAERQ